MQEQEFKWDQFAQGLRRCPYCEDLGFGWFAATCDCSQLEKEEAWREREQGS